MRNKTLFAVTHGYFLHNLVLNFLTCDKELLESKFYTPRNNSLTIIDFDVNEVLNKVGEPYVSVMPRLVAHNVQMIDSIWHS